MYDTTSAASDASAEAEGENVVIEMAAAAGNVPALAGAFDGLRTARPSAEGMGKPQHVGALVVLVSTVSCGGRVALIDDGPATPAKQAEAVDAATPAPAPTIVPVQVDRPEVSDPSSCDRQSAATSIIASNRCEPTCTDDDIAELTKHCGCGDFRVKVRGACVDAVESWTRSVQCVADAILGQRFCSLSGDEPACIDLRIPCAGNAGGGG